MCPSRHYPIGNRSEIPTIDSRRPAVPRSPVEKIRSGETDELERLLSNRKWISTRCETESLRTARSPEQGGMTNPMATF